MTQIVTRFAPSPTGFLHIGGARTALFNYLFAKSKGGKFLLRIEDTDKKRSTKEATDVILEGLKWLGLSHDEEIVYQSKNEKKHQEVANKLLKEGKAYYCYTSAEELVGKRKEAESKKEVFRFKSPWRENSIKDIPEGVDPVIRIKAPMEGEMKIKDLVQGEVKIPCSELDDMVILRSDGSPTYNLAVVIDDNDMGITHVLRGDDHLTNSFKQKMIYQALDFKIPEFAHLPLIHGSDGAKMSKRHGATSITEYEEMGYLPEALRNYLLRLGWSHGDEEIISDENAIKWFDVEKIGKSPARFDFDKLNNLNKHYIKGSGEESLLQLIGLGSDLDQESKGRILTALKFLKERAVTLNDLIKSAIVYQNNHQKTLSEKDQEIIQNKKEIAMILGKALNSLENYDHDNIKEAINNFATSNNLKMKDFAPALRIILTFSSSSAGGIFDIIEILGKKEVLNRFNLIIK